MGAIEIMVENLPNLHGAQGSISSTKRRMEEKKGGGGRKGRREGWEGRREGGNAVKCTMLYTRGGGRTLTM